MKTATARNNNALWVETVRYALFDGFYSHENGQIVLEFGQYSYGALTNRYVWGPQTDLLLVNEFNSASYGAGKIYYGLGDLVNTVHDSAKYNSSTGLSAVITHRYIDAFGAAGSYLTFDGTSYSGGPFIYTGRFRDDMTGLQWNLHRWYDTYTARWMSEDPIGFGGGDYNLYRYLGNSPLANIDPTGTLLISIFRGHGRYCGIWRSPNPGGCVGGRLAPWRLPPIDALDAACAAHDCCLSTWSRFVDPCRQVGCAVPLCKAAWRPNPCFGSPSFVSCMISLVEIRQACVAAGISFPLYPIFER